jgi:hypothetical protein
MQDIVWVRWRKNDLTGCVTINDLQIGKGKLTPENHPLIVVRGFFHRVVRHIGG